MENELNVANSDLVKSFYYIKRHNNQTGDDEVFVNVNEEKSGIEAQCWDKINSFEKLVEDQVDGNTSEILANFDSKEKIMEILDGINSELKGTQEYQEIKVTLDKIRCLPNYSWVKYTSEGDASNADLFGTVHEALVQLNTILNEMDEAGEKYDMKDYFLICMKTAPDYSVSHNQLSNEEMQRIRQDEVTSQQKQYTDIGVRRSFKKKTSNLLGDTLP